MRPIDVRNLTTFNARMGMYVCRSNRENIVSFLHGYECGAGAECQFTKILTEHLTRKHRVESNPSGWPDQIARLAERNSLDWMEIYLLVTEEVLSATVVSSNDHGEHPVAPDCRDPA